MIFTSLFASKWPDGPNASVFPGGGFASLFGLRLWAGPWFPVSLSMNQIGSILFWLFLALSSLLCFPVAVLIRLVTGPFDRRLRVLHWFTCFWASLYTWVNPFWRVRIEKPGHIDRGQAYMMVSNHQSMVDIFALFRTFFHFKYVSKAEIFKFPLIGWNMKLNRYIGIERGTVRGSVGMMRECESTLKQGSSLVIFPEGTRSSTGKLGRFKAGAFDLARKADVPILPIVIDGSANALPVGSIILKGVHRVRVHVLDPIPVEVVRSHSSDELMAMTRDIIAAELASMRGENPADSGAG